MKDDGTTMQLDEATGPQNQALVVGQEFAILGIAVSDDEVGAVFHVGEEDRAQRSGSDA